MPAISTPGSTLLNSPASCWSATTGVARWHSTGQPAIPTEVLGIAFMETIMRPMSWDDLPNSRPRYEALRSPGSGEAKVLDENFFIEQALRATVLSGLNDEDHAVYRAPYPTRESRRPLLEWPRAMPIEGEPADVVARIEAYDAWLAASADVPKLLLTFEGPAETLLIGEAMTAWCRANIANLDIESAARPAMSCRRINPRQSPPPSPDGRIATSFVRGSDGGGCHRRPRPLDETSRVALKRHATEFARRPPLFFAKLFENNPSLTNDAQTIIFA